MLRGELDSAAAPALREYLLDLVGECSGRLVIDLSAVTGANPGCLTVLVGTGRRASCLGGLLLLAAPAVALMMRQFGPRHVEGCGAPAGLVDIVRLTEIQGPG
jgi:anti-anti-sigma regulatory factor